MNNDLLDNVSKLSMEYGSKISLCATGKFFGIHHGGKAQKYLIHTYIIVQSILMINHLEVQITTQQ